ncbi:hypothetical protein J4573_02980 [Actinomadura barringtoniae]|uniref:Uncharacterized protein n=1 Tax=Actinomadura barringtoniae TaxID=1427535 RepID=A0A939P668_9ACTN|nr:hypothetical protein [Actinomadura barringtoniae]MBO2446038.1 hypothetical protein [Actinomadura barringtoniae]
MRDAVHAVVIGDFQPRDGRHVTVIANNPLPLLGSQVKPVVDAALCGGAAR